MLSSLNSFGGLSAANILTLFGANAASSTKPVSTSAAQPASTGVSASGASDPASTIKAILAQAQIARAEVDQALAGPSGAASAISIVAQAAYADQTDSSSATVNASASETISSPTSVQSAESEQWGINAATEAAAVAVSEASDEAGANGVASLSAQERIGRGATDPWGGGLVVSVLGDAASSADADGSSSAASASATFLAPNAYQQIASGDGSTVSVADAATSAQTNGSSALGGANVTLALPNTAQQIAYAVAVLSAETVYSESTGAITVTPADAINVTVSNGAISQTGAPDAALPSGFPSLAIMQQGIDVMASSNPQSYPARNGLDLSTYQGSLTLVQLPPDSNFAVGDNFITLRTGGDQYNNWALVLPQDTVTATVSDAQTTS